MSWVLLSCLTRKNQIWKENLVGLAKQLPLGKQEQVRGEKEFL